MSMGSPSTLCRRPSPARPAPRLRRADCARRCSGRAPSAWSCPADEHDFQRAHAVVGGAVVKGDAHDQHAVQQRGDEQHVDQAVVRQCGGRSAHGWHAQLGTKLTAIIVACVRRTVTQFRSAGSDAASSNGLHQVAGDVDPVGLVELPNAGGAGDVDLRQVIADHVESEEQDAALRRARRPPARRSRDRAA